MDAEEKKEIEAMFKHHVGVLAESFQAKLDIVVEGHQMLSDKIDRLDARMDRLEGRMDRLESKVDAVAGDLAAHRKDTEAHGAVWRVKENEA